MRRRIEKACIILFFEAASFLAPGLVSAHIIDERPGLGTGMTIMLSIFWVAVVVGIILLVRRLMRPRQDGTRIRNERKDRTEKE